MPKYLVTVVEHRTFEMVSELSFPIEADDEQEAHDIADELWSGTPQDWEELDSHQTSYATHIETLDDDDEYKELINDQDPDEVHAVPPGVPHV